MRILQIHNFYQQAGGEDQVAAAEYNLLTDKGHFVQQYLIHNDTVASLNPLQLAAKTIWNSSTYGEIRRLIRTERFDIVHAHNTFPLVSPALYYAAHAESVPVVQTLHNYRLLCPAATLFRNGHVCQECVGRAVPYPGVVHACYRSSRSATAVTASMLTAHRAARTWTNKINVYVALTEFARQKFIQGGLPPEKLQVKPNFLSYDPGLGPGDGGYALFIGRLSREKGLQTLLDAWASVKQIPLKIAGDGPMRDYVQTRASALSNVEYLGRRDSSEIIALLQAARFLVFPSVWFEGLPMTIIEALACGTPVLASDLGAMSELIRNNANGWLFTPGDPRDLSNRAETLNADCAMLGRIRAQTRENYLLNYTSEQNYNHLLKIYEGTLRP